MALVDIETALLFETFAFMLPLIGGFIPHLRGEDLRLLVLHHAAYITRDTLSITSVPLYKKLVQLLMLDCILRQFDLPHAVTDRLQTISLVLLPVIHIAFDINSGCIRTPLAENPSFRRMVQTEIEVTGRPLRQRLTTCDLFLLIDCIIVTTLQCRLIRLQIRITLHELQVFYFLCCHNCMCFFVIR